MTWLEQYREWESRHADAKELAWWRYFAQRFEPGSLPRVGSHVMGRFRIAQHDPRLDVWMAVDLDPSRAVEPEPPLTDTEREYMLKCPTWKPRR